MWKEDKEKIAFLIEETVYICFLRAGTLAYIYRFVTLLRGFTSFFSHHIHARLWSKYSAATISFSAITPRIPWFLQMQKGARSPTRILQTSRIEEAKKVVDGHAGTKDNKREKSQAWPLRTAQKSKRYNEESGI